MLPFAGGGRDGAAQLERTVGDLLKQAVLAPSGSTKGLWQLYADFYAATGFHASAREALLKHVRYPLECAQSPVMSL